MIADKVDVVGGDVGFHQVVLDESDERCEERDFRGKSDEMEAYSLRFAIHGEVQDDELVRKSQAQQGVHSNQDRGSLTMFSRFSSLKIFQLSSG